MPEIAKESYSQAKQYPRTLLNDSQTYLFLKRSLDIIGAMMGLLVLSLVFLFIAICIKLEDPKGKVFFSQERVGKDGKVFKMYKFRSMISNAEELLQQLMEQNEVSGAMFKMKKDPRVTRIGAVIRKTSMDELPQLFNVLKGDMSLVGPRPPLLREVELYTPYDKQRLLVTPGCTGLWQVSGRSNVGFAKMVELDLEYIENRTFMYDVKLILKTIVVLLGSDDAY